LTIKAVKVPEVLDYGNVTALYKVCEVPDLKYTVLEKITGIKAEKLNAENLRTALDYFYPDEKDKLQVNIGLVFTKEERFPVFHLVFEGNETDITTVGRAISRLKEEGCHLLRCEDSCVEEEEEE
jgi:transposase